MEKNIAEGGGACDISSMLPDNQSSEHTPIMDSSILLDPENEEKILTDDENIYLMNAEEFMEKKCAEDDSVCHISPELLCNQSSKHPSNCHGSKVRFLILNCKIYFIIGIGSAIGGAVVYG